MEIGPIGAHGSHPATNSVVTLGNTTDAGVEPKSAIPATEAAADERFRVNMPIDVRSASLALLTLLVSVYILHWAAAVFVPLLMGLMFSYALKPPCDRLERWHVPRALGAGLLMLALLGGLAGTVYTLEDDATELVESLPEATQKLRESLRPRRGAPEGAIEKMQRAAADLERAAEESSVVAPAADRGVTRVQIERPRFNIKDYVWSGTLGLVGLVGQITVVIFITYFLLASGNDFRRKMVRIAGPTLSEKKVTIQVLDEITEQIQRYLLVQVLTSILVGVATGLVLWWIGLERAAVWGVVAAVLNLVPYVGAIILAAGLALVGLLQFGEVGPALLASGASIAIHIVSGNLLTPWLTGRTSRMNPVVIFVGVLAWGWLWGVWGLLLGAPILMAVKAVCDRVEELKPVGELLGR